MKYDYSKLKCRVVKICKTRKNFADKMGLSERTISMKLNNNGYFSQDEIDKAVSILHLQDSDIQSHFFSKEETGYKIVELLKENGG